MVALLCAMVHACFCKQENFTSVKHLCSCRHIKVGGMFGGADRMAMAPAPWDNGPCLKMYRCQHLGELWLSVVVQLSTEEISVRRSASEKR